MGLFGKKKELTEMALEEARRFDAADAKDGSTPKAPAEPKQTKAKHFSFTTSFSTSGEKDAALSSLMAKAFGGDMADPSKVTPGESVSVTTVRHMSADDPQLKDALDALGFGPDVLQQAQSLGPQKHDSGFSAALDAIERDYKGKPVAEAKAAIEAALKEHHHAIPDMVVDLLAKGISEGTSIDVKFGGSPQTPPA